MPAIHPATNPRPANQRNSQGGSETRPYSPIHGAPFCSLAIHRQASTGHGCVASFARGIPSRLARPTRRKAAPPAAAFAMFVLLLAACARPAHPTATAALPPATPTSEYLTQEQAIRSAIELCSTPHICALETPSVVRAVLLTQAEARQQLALAEAQPLAGVPLDARVWLVQLQGRFEICGGPQPVGTGEPEPLTDHQCDVMMEAKTGGPRMAHLGR
jgi:hypothetical protein